jgi:hypothetical protein
MAGKSPEMPASEWLTYSAAAERLGVSPSSIALRAGRWPMRKRSDTGEVEIEVPGTVLGVTLSSGERALTRSCEAGLLRLYVGLTGPGLAAKNAL